MKAKTKFILMDVSAIIVLIILIFVDNMLKGLYGFLLVIVLVLLFLTITNIWKFEEV